MYTESFSQRHIGPDKNQIQEMLQTLKLSQLDDLQQRIVPKSILSQKDLPVDKALNETQILRYAQELAQQNQISKSYIGQGYYPCLLPTVIQRNILENPAWYTAYTPYQAEISQGRLEALINFQTMVSDLTQMDLTNASLLDEGTALAEAVTMAYGINMGKSKKVIADENIFPHSFDVLKTRSEHLGYELIQEPVQPNRIDENTFAVVLQYPNKNGTLDDYQNIVKAAQAHKCLVVVATDLMALTLFKPPGEWGADIVVGSSQRFGLPMGFGGPHSGFLSTKEKYKRLVPGRIIGVSKDKKGKVAYRMALQTREQHIRREKATSNICTAQVLLAVISGMYAVYHGPQGLKNIGQEIHSLTITLKQHLQQLGLKVLEGTLFDTVQVALSADLKTKLEQEALKKKINFFYPDPQTVQISLSELTETGDVHEILELFAGLSGKKIMLHEVQDSFAKLQKNPISSEWQRKSQYLTHPVFNQHHSESEMVRYIFKLQNRDLSLVHSMIPLGSCTMKLNATTEMIPITWSGFSHIHPFAPLDQTKGYLKLIEELEQDLCAVTGFDGVSLQPNAGSQGEYAGLLAIKNYFLEKGEQNRHICLIPSSAHGTNPASAIMAGMKVQVVQCDSEGNIDLNDLKEKAGKYKEDLAALMITYPSTHGVFEQEIVEICQTIHEFGGQVYMDGANLNALIGLSYPGKFGPDVAHLNLHKTFCIPHGGGGPGVGPIVVKEHLKPFLPGHIYAAQKTKTGAIASAPWGSALILPISWSYIKMMGSQGLKKASQVAILNANYIAEKLKPHFKILYTGQGGFVAHECILDMRPFKASAGITVDDIAKRLMDYGFHAPTMSWPVVGTLMVEPTESESLEELDRFIEAMISIRREISMIEQQEWPQDNNPLVNAPHTLDDLLETWERPYNQEIAVRPGAWQAEFKYWPHVNRIDNAFGDKNLFCSCPPLSDFS